MWQVLMIAVARNGNHESALSRRPKVVPSLNAEGSLCFYTGSHISAAPT